MSLFQKKLKIPSKDTIIWRYMSFEKFLYLIMNEKLYLCRLDKLTDQYEGTVPDNNRKNINLRLKKVPLITREEKIEKYNHEIKRIHAFKQFTLINCWSMYEEESFALWKIYTKPGYGIAIKSKFGLLQDSLANNKELDFGIVEYNNKQATAETQTSIPVTKKIYYKYENELRVLLYDQYDNRGATDISNFEPLYEKGKEVDVNIKILIDSVYLSPSAPDWFEEIVRILLSGILNKDFNNKVIRSNIKDDL